MRSDLLRHVQEVWHHCSDHIQRLGIPSAPSELPLSHAGTLPVDITCREALEAHEVVDVQRAALRRAPVAELGTPTPCESWAHVDCVVGELFRRSHVDDDGLLERTG